MSKNKIWSNRFIALAEHISLWSKDESSKVGCVIVGPANEVRSTGFNGFVRGVNENIPERKSRPAKYSWTEHAERNAIYNAARVGIPLEGCTMYLHWFPCVDCARAIIQAGIKTLVAKKPNLDDPNWGNDFKIAIEMFNEADVEINWYE